MLQVCLKHEDPTIDKGFCIEEPEMFFLFFSFFLFFKGFCIEELAEMYECVDNNDCSDGSVSLTVYSCFAREEMQNVKKHIW